LEIDNPRSYLISSIYNTSAIYINVANKKAFSTLYRTLHGKYDVTVYSRDTIWSYVDELNEYTEAVFYITDAAVSVLFWRPTTTIYVGRMTFNLPVHSMFAFLFFTYFVEHPELLPSAILILVGWLLLAVMMWREQHPNPWYRTPNFLELAELLILKKIVMSVSEIEKDEKKEETALFEEKWKSRVKAAYDEAKKKNEELAKEKIDAAKEIGETSVDISSKTGGINIDPLMFILYPLQEYLELGCTCLRVIRNVVTWEEPFIAFWIVVLSFTGAIIFAFIPWAFLLRWAMRIVVWIVFGPWMILVDRFHYRKLESMTEEEKNLRLLQLKMKRQDLTKQLALKARVARENAFKLRDAKEMMFGKFIAKIPTFKVDRYRDTPLPSSTAKHYNTAEVRFRVLLLIIYI
jgi:hypothetical protein